MSIQQAVQRVISPDFVGTVKAEATDDAGQIRVTLGTRGEVASVTALDLTAGLKSEQALRDAVIEAANRAEGVRVMSELAQADALDPATDSSAPARMAPLPGPIAPRLVVRSPDEQADHLARYINAGGLEPIEAPGLRRTTASNGYLSLAFNDRGQVVDVTADQEWLYAVNLDRLNNALKEAVDS